MINLTKTICASILMMSTSDAKLTVYGPQSLKNLFEDQNNEIKTTLANFGHIPYGQSMVGRLYYNASNPYGCNPSNGFTDDFSGDPDGIVTPIIMVKQGNCSYVT
jgi:hypothetical protein